jgi:trehalose 6-phosphate phosphatase
MLPVPDRRRTALFLDFDGTLVDIAPQPQSIRLLPHTAELLVRLDEALSGALALVSGRAISDLDLWLRPYRGPAAGVHGAQFRQHGSDTLQEAASLPAPLRRDIEHLAASHPGTLIEDKGLAFALHVRHVAGGGEGPLAARIGADLAGIVARHATAEAEIIAGDNVFEVKRAGIDKGGAILRLMETPPFRHRSIVFIGDDTTDAIAFARLRDHGATCYSVGRDWPHAIRAFDRPQQVHDWLWSLVHARDVEACDRIRETPA